MSMRVFVVMKSCGEYSDTYQEVDSVWYAEADAQRREEEIQGSPVESPYTFDEWIAWVEERCAAMRVIAHALIRRVSDGEVREHVHDWTETHEKWMRGELSSPGHDLSDTLSAIRFWWEEGNGSCDCNKRLYFAEVGDEDEEEVPGEELYRCIGSGRYELAELRIEVTD